MPKQKIIKAKNYIHMHIYINAYTLKVKRNFFSFIVILMKKISSIINSFLKWHLYFLYWGYFKSNISLRYFGNFRNWYFSVKKNMIYMFCNFVVCFIHIWDNHVLLMNWLFIIIQYFALYLVYFTFALKSTLSDINIDNFDWL